MSKIQEELDRLLDTKKMISEIFTPPPYIPKKGLPQIIFNRIISISIFVIDEKTLKKWMKKHSIKFNECSLYCCETRPNKNNIFIEYLHHPTMFSLSDVEKEMKNEIFKISRKITSVP